MLWFSLAFMTALASATEAATLKRYFPQLGPFEAALYPTAYSLPYYLLLLPFLHQPQIHPDYWATCLILLPVNVVGMVLYYRAINLAPLSLTLPYIAFTPAFVLGTGYLILGEVPNSWGALGVGCITLGCYILNIDTRKTGGWTAPLRAAVANPGSRSALAAAMIFGLAAVLGKKGIAESDPLFFMATFFPMQAATLLILLPLTGLARLSCLRHTPGKGAVLGALFFLHILFHCTSVALTKTAYAISIKRLNAVISVILGALWLGESNIRNRLAGASLMFIGAAIIGLLGQ